MQNNYYTTNYIRLDTKS